MKTNIVNGFTLIELLVANFIGLILITMVITLFFSIKNTYQLETGIHVLHENINLANYFLRRDIEQASFIGCGDFSAIKYLNPEFTRKFGLLGATNASILPEFLANRALPETDTIIIEKMLDPINYLCAPMTQMQQLMVYNEDYYAPGDKLLITNCENSEILQVKESHRLNDKTIIIPQNALTKLYGKNSWVGRLSAIAYFIAQSENNNMHGQRVNALYRKDLFSSVFKPDELIAGVNNMKIKYAVYQNKKLVHVSADAVTDWKAVVGVHITLLMDSVEPALTQNYPFEFAQKKYFPKDFRLYKIWNLSISRGSVIHVPS